MTAGSLQEIFDGVCAKHGCCRRDILGPSRLRFLVLARQEGYWRAANETRESLRAIARAFGRTDHKTVLHGIRRYASRMEAAAIPNRLRYPQDGVVRGRV